MLIHEFVLVSEVPKEICYTNYSQEQMTLISDDFILKYNHPIRRVEMYCENLQHKIMGLSYHGTTILDNEMAEKLKIALTIFCAQSEDLTKLLDILEQAILQKKYIIHFGI